MHHPDHFASTDLERCTGVHGSGGRQTQPDDCREGLLSDKIACGQKSDCGFLALLRDDSDLCTAFLQIEHRVRPVSLAKKCLLWLQLDNRSAEPSLCKKGGGIEWSAVIAPQNATSLQAVCFGWPLHAQGGVATSCYVWRLWRMDQRPRTQCSRE